MNITEIFTDEEIDEIIKVIKKKSRGVRIGRDGNWANFRSILYWLKEKTTGSSTLNAYYFKFLYNFIEEFPEEIKNKLIANSL